MVENLERTGLVERRSNRPFSSRLLAAGRVRRAHSGPRSTPRQAAAPRAHLAVAPGTLPLRLGAGVPVKVRATPAPDDFRWLGRRYARRPNLVLRKSATRLGGGARIEGEGESLGGLAAGLRAWPWRRSGLEPAVSLQECQRLHRDLAAPRQLGRRRVAREVHAPAAVVLLLGFEAVEFGLDQLRVEELADRPAR